MPNINITVREKIAHTISDTCIVCGNSDYVAVFDFDAEWDAYEVKTARFIWGGTFTDVPFTGNECPVPVIPDAVSVLVGVYAGDLHTTTAAAVGVRRSILGGSETEAEVSREIRENLDKMMAEKITRPTVVNKDDLLTVKEVDADSIPIKWGAIKQTHYDNREEITLANVTVENVAEDRLVKLADADIDLNKIDRYRITVEYVVNEETKTFDSGWLKATTHFDKSVTLGMEEGNVIVLYDGTEIPEYPSEIIGVMMIYLATKQAADAFTQTDGLYTPGLYIQAFAGDIKHTCEVIGHNGELHTLDPKYIKDMYFAEPRIQEIKGYDGWNAAVYNESNIKNDVLMIPRVRINGKVYANVPVSCPTTYVTLNYNIGNYVLYIERRYGSVSVKGGDIQEGDPVFLINAPVYHTIPEEYIPDTIARSADVQPIQSDWKTYDETDPSYIKNKPKGFDHHLYNYTNYIDSDSYSITSYCGAMGGSIIYENLTVASTDGDLFLQFTNSAGGGQTSIRIGEGKYFGSEYTSELTIDIKRINDAWNPEHCLLTIMLNAYNSVDNIYRQRTILADFRYANSFEIYSSGGQIKRGYIHTLRW